jgi:hypothetical protein
MGSSIGSPISVGSFNDLKKTLLISGGIVVNTTRRSKKSLQGSTEVWIIGSNEDAVNMERLLSKHWSSEHTPDCCSLLILFS